MRSRLPRGPFLCAILDIERLAGRRAAAKAEADPVVGLDLARRARRLTDLPLVAIGSIDEQRTPVLAAAADGVPVIAVRLGEHDRAARPFGVRMAP